MVSDRTTSRLHREPFGYRPYVLLWPYHSLCIIGPNGEGATVVLDDPRIGEALWWAPDGRILFSYREDPASRQDHYGVYSIRVDERTGKATGPPQPITQAEGSIRVA